MMKGGKLGGLYEVNKVYNPDGGDGSNVILPSLNPPHLSSRMSRFRNIALLRFLLMSSFFSCLYITLLSAFGALF
jgi:hypothetical protein